MNRVFGRKKAPGPPPPSLGEASSGVGNQMESMDGEYSQWLYYILLTLFSNNVTKNKVSNINNIFYSP